MKFAKVVVNELHAICMPLSLNDSTVLSAQVTRVLCGQPCNAVHARHYNSSPFFYTHHKFSNFSIFLITERYDT